MEPKLSDLIREALTRARADVKSALTPSTVDKRKLALAVTNLEQALLWATADETGILA